MDLSIQIGSPGQPYGAFHRESCCYLLPEILSIPICPNPLHFLLLCSFLSSFRRLKMPASLFSSALRMRALVPTSAIPKSFVASSVARRSLFTQPRPSPAGLASRVTLPRPQLRQYADAAPAPKKKRAGVLRWAWRLTQFSVVVGVGLLGFLIYDSRHPPDQIPPDPSKKTLVILGMCYFAPHARVR